jgi:hypothetical protein
MAGNTKPQEKLALKHAKIGLYSLILNTDPDDVTESEARLGYELARDPDIQEVLKNALQKQTKET